MNDICLPKIAANFDIKSIKYPTVEKIQDLSLPQANDTINQVNEKVESVEQFKSIEQVQSVEQVKHDMAELAQVLEVLKMEYTGVMIGEKILKAKVFDSNVSKFKEFQFKEIKKFLIFYTLSVLLK